MGGASIRADRGDGSRDSGVEPGILAGDDPATELLPWAGAHGQSCLQLADGEGAASRLADRIENVQLGLADRLLWRTRDALAAQGPNAGEVAALADQLADALADTLLIARSRGARLGGAGRVLPGEDTAVPLSVGVVGGVMSDSPAAPRAYGLRSFPGGDLASAPAARHHVRGTARSWGLSPGVMDGLETITGELVANALEHSDGRTVTVTCALMARAVTISVVDEGDSRAPVTSPTQARRPGPDQEQGRGLLITQTLANRWGTWRTRAGGGLTVWAEILVESADLARHATPTPTDRRRHTGRREEP